MIIAGLSKEVKGADAQLRDLRRTVEYVENNRDSFAHIDNVSRFVALVVLRGWLGGRISCVGRAHRSYHKPSNLAADIGGTEALWYCCTSDVRGWGRQTAVSCLSGSRVTPIYRTA